MATYQYPDSHVFYRKLTRRFPLITHGEGCWLVDADGRRYPDGSGGAFVANLGHGVKEIGEAMAAQAAKVAYLNGTAFTNEPVEALADALAPLLPGDLDKLYFLGSGSEAVEAALKLARQYWVETGRSTRRARGSGGRRMSKDSRRFAVTIKTGADPRSHINNGQRVTVVPLTIKRRQNRKVLTTPPSAPTDASVGGFDEPMIKTLGKGFYWQRLLDEGRHPHVGDLARKQKLERGWISEILRMTLLAPDIITAIDEGRQPRHINLHALRGRIDVIPHDWNEQRRLLGFPEL